MKKIKIITAVTFLFLGVQSFAQTIVDGKYSSTFGNVSMTTEVDKEFPNGSLIYGDYRDNGTISGYYADFQKEIKGSFFNGSSEGKFIFMLPFAMSANTLVESMNGFWGYNSDNKNSTNANDKWNITSRTGNAINIKNVTNVWSGKWNTTDGEMHLVQLGNKITGRYKGLGTVTATYNPSTRLLKGTFLNQRNSKTGYIEFYFEGNTFKGKWGWNAAMTEGNWDGTKSVKNNNELSKMPISSSASTTTAAAKQNNNGLVKYRFTFVRICNGDTYLLQRAKLYGFGGIRVYRVTNNNRVEIKSFGNKPANIFDKTEDNPYGLYCHDFPQDNVGYYREFNISQADLNNPDVDIEVEIYHHLKGKVAGSNDNYGYHKETLNIENIVLDERENFKGNFFVGKNISNGTTDKSRKKEDHSSVLVNLKQI